MSAADHGTLADRYGGAGGSRRWLLPVVASLLLTGLTAFAVWAGWSDATKPVRAGVRTFAVTPTSVEATVEVRKAGDRAAVCRLTALDADRVDVGSSDVEMPAGRELSTYRLATSSRAHTVEIGSCRLR